MAKQPEWAKRLVTKVCYEYGVPQPTVNWRKSKKLYATGRCSRNRLTITATNDSKDTRGVLLHELAHWIVHHHKDIPDSQRGGHSRLFWNIAFQLYSDKSNRLKKRQLYYSREFAYKSTARQAYRARILFDNKYKIR